MVGSRYLEWLQHAMNVLVGIFQRYGFAAIVSKSRNMTCQPSALRSGISMEAKALNCTGVGDYYCVKPRQIIPYPECGFDLTAGSMTTHLQHMHGTEP